MKLSLALVFLTGSLFAADPIALSLADFTDAKGAPAPSGWVAEADGVIHRSARAGDIISKNDYESFEIEWEWKVAEGGNSGLKYWVSKAPKGALVGVNGNGWKEYIEHLISIVPRTRPFDPSFPRMIVEIGGKHQISFIEHKSASKYSMKFHKDFGGHIRHDALSIRILRRRL